MVHLPTRQEIHAAVDQRFRAELPDAPSRLSRDDPDHAAMRARWLEIRGEWLDAEVDREYWEAHPDAPRQLDPDDPVHAAYVQAWLDIRARIMSDPPEPEDGDDLSGSEIPVQKLTDSDSASIN